MRITEGSGNLTIVHYTVNIHMNRRHNHANKESITEPKPIPNSLYDLCIKVREGHTIINTRGEKL